MADDHPEESPYVYCSDNPVNIVDDDGMLGHWETDPGDPNKKIWVLDPVYSYANTKTNASIPLEISLPYFYDSSILGEVLKDAVEVGGAVGFVVTASLTMPGDKDTWKPEVIPYQLNEEQENSNNEIKYSKHAEDRMKEQGVSKERVKEAIKKGRTQQGNEPGTVEHYLPSSQSKSGRGIRVVTNGNGNVITVTDKGTSWKGRPVWK